MNKDLPAGIFCEAWELLLDIPLPAFLKPKTPATPPDTAVLLTLPVAGLLCGMAAWILFSVSGLILPPFGNAVLTGLGMTILLLGKDSGRGVQLFMEFCCLLSQRQKMADIPAVLKRRRISERQDPVSSLCLVMVAGLTVFAWIMLANFHVAGWIVPVLLMGAAVQGSLLPLHNLQDGAPFLQIQDKDRNKLWILTGFLMLFPAIAHPLPVLIAFGVSFLLAAAVRRFCEDTYGGITPEVITLTGFLAELFTLLAGLILVR